MWLIGVVFAGPNHGRPMQLVMNEGVVVDQQLGGPSNGVDNSRKGKSALKRSWGIRLRIMFVYPNIWLWIIFLAYSFYPGRGDDSPTFPSVPSRFETEAHQFSNPNDDSDGDLESEGDWLDDTQVAQKAPSKMSEAVGIEVRQQHFHCFLLTSNSSTFVEAFVADS
jgi:hypothetical protein